MWSRRCAPARSRSSRRSTASAPAPGLCWRWPPICASARRAARPRFCFACRTGRLRHGSLRAAAARDRAGTRVGAAVHGTLDVGRGGGALGIFQQRAGTGGAARRGTRAGARTGRWSHFRTRHDEKNAATGMEYGRRRSHRGGGAGAGDLHGDQRFPSRLSRLRGEAKTAIRGRLMADKNYLEWPFFEPRHAALEQALDALATQHIEDGHGSDVDEACRHLVRLLGEGGWLRHAIGGVAHGGVAEAIDTRAICLIRETLARHSGLADFAFAMQGLGSGAISLFGSDEQRAHYLPRVASGAAIAASEPQAGSDVAAMQCAAVRDGDDYILDGEKTWISNGGIADFYVVFARTGEAEGSRGISAFIVDADTPGFEIAQRINVIAPHPLARLRFDRCRVPAGRRIGAAGQGFKVAMATLDVFRTSVAAAALGYARRALDEALRHAQARQMFGHMLADFQLTQAKLAQMATGIDAAALLTYRAAWQRDQGRKVTKEAAMAKMTATETAQQVIDAALQMFGGMGVVSDHPVERLYREIRALRIYEGATEVQQLIIARELLRDSSGL